jgi:phosphoglycerol transferase
MNESLTGPSRARRIALEVLLYAAGAVLAVVLFCRVYHLRQASLHVPFHLPGDGAYYGAQVKTLLEKGWVHENADLGYPFGLELYDFPHFDNLFLLLMKGIGLFSSDWAVVLNLYYILTFPLIALTALLLLRRLGVQPLIALACALLYAFQPYHLLRGQGHIMLASYFLLPLFVLVALWLSEERGLGRGDGGRWFRSGRLLAALLLCLLAGTGGHYYACFACLFFLVAALRCAVLYRRVGPLLQAGLLGVVVAASFTLNLLPSLLYWSEHGPNRTVSIKPEGDSEKHGLKLAQLFGPVPGHRLPPLTDLSNRYFATSPVLNENISSAVGVQASLGLLVLLGLFFWPRRSQGDGSPLPALGAMTLAAVLLATVGGLGSMLAYTLSPQFHAWNRVSIYLALFGLTALAWLLDRGLRRLSRPLLRSALAGVLAVLMLGGGLYDQVTPSLLPNHRQARADFQRLDDFGAAIEKMLPPGSAVYQWPPTPFPFDDGRVGYAHFELYLHTHGLRLSDPTMLNRRGNTWQEKLTRLPVESFLDELARAGFDGLVLHVFRDRPVDVHMLADVKRCLNQESIHDGQARHFFDLRNHARAWRARTGQQTASLDELCPVSVSWGASFRIREHEGDPAWPAWRWCLHPRSEVTLTNHTDRALLVDLRLKLAAGPRRPSRGLRLAGLIELEIDLSPEGTELSHRVHLAPGAHRLSFTCTRPENHFGHGLLWFRAGDLEYRVVEDSPALQPQVAIETSAGTERGGKR